MKIKKEIAQQLLNTIGGMPKVVRYYDDQDISSIDIYVGENRPTEGVNTYATIGLSDYSIGLQLSAETELRIELISACGDNYDKFSNILSSCAFNIINNQYSCRPGTVYANVVQEYYKDFNMKHILFVSPFLWENLSDIQSENNHITWLMPIPISDSEMNYLEKEGLDALEDMFEQNDIDVFDLERSSVC